MMISARYFAFNASNFTSLSDMLSDFYSIYLPTATVYILTIIFGFLGNAMTICAVLSFRSLRTNATYIILSSQSVADILVSVVVGLASAAGTFIGGEFFIEHDFLCQFIAIVCFVSCATTLLSMGFLALNRFLAILHPQSYRKWFTVPRALFYCFLTWLVSFLIESINYTEIGARVYDRKTKSCLFDRLKKGFTIPFVVVCIYLPWITITACYLKIYLFIRHKKKRVKQATSARNDSIDVAKSLFAVFIVFVICWLPVSIVLLMGFDDQFPPWLHAYCNLVAHMNSSLNPILYAIFNPTLRDGYKFVLNKISFSLLFRQFAFSLKHVGKS
nr:G protein-coupled receptor [Proales similis]